MSENYIPLYRKYRPQNLQQVVGQEHVKKALTNAIELNKISHAYLFTGPRGTGKTSIARILAKSLNCQKGPTVTPCEECPSCTDIKNSTPIDVIEIDAASNRKVEDTQNILEKIQYAPVNGKYKIYIIDEVHMLSTHAFNALLKTLEEPPENVIFILATTEPQKVLETIISRCQRFDFRRITTEDIIKHLKYISEQEDIKIEDDALFTIAKNAAGGMRDSLAMLDQVSVLDNAKTITAEDINKLLGRLSFDMLNKLSNDIISSNPQSAIELIEQIYNAGNEPSQILLNLLGYLKNMLVVKNCSGDDLLMDLTQLNSSQIKTLKSQVENVDTHQIVFLIEKVTYYIRELKTTTNQHLWLEVAVIDFANLAENTSLLQLQDRITKLEGGVVESSYVPTHVVREPAKSQARPKEVIEEPKARVEEKAVKPQVDNTEVKAVSRKEEVAPQAIDNDEDSQVMPVSQPKEQSELGNLWLGLLQNISSAPTVSLLSEHAKPIEISEEKVVLGCEKEVFVKMLNSDNKKKAITEAAKKFFGKEVSVLVKQASADEFPALEKKKIISETKKVVSAPVAKPVEENEDDDYAEHELEKLKKKDDPVMTSDQVSMVMKLFDGKYID